MVQLEKMMSSTLDMQSKLQETMQLWLKRHSSENKSEANRLQTIIKTHPASKTTAMASIQYAKSNQRQWISQRCFECDDFGHMSNECPRKGQGLRKCYECQQFTKHKAYECEQRLLKTRGRGLTIAGIND
ncbi:uncharacterized protein LOC122501874 [Leptopilina heterotoma]|uniref:uncharacterized protein LOC122501874 n=1 Tax=Leptopilina heterotoma TaxID=63436 RepID=UPI001CA9D187|nr:uncharacterized protein LOC122501874 [Leptopilina heterotoma]